MNEQGTDKIKIIGLILQAIGIVSIFFGGCSVLTARKALIDQHEWNRRQFTLVTLKDFNKDVDPFRELVLKRFPGIHDSSKVSNLTRGEAETLYKLTPGDTNYADRKAISQLLNYVEFVCTACEARVADEEIVYELYHGLFIRLYEHLKEYIAVSQQVLGGKQYAPIVRIVQEWISRRDGKPSNKKDITGQL